MLLSPELAERYNRPTPRYTSYPPANYFTEDFTEAHYREAVIASNSANPQHVSFYIHIPFCPHLCHYCACNAYAMRKAPEVEAYMQALLQEIELVLPLIDKGRKLAQIHYGGGTPSAAPLEWISRINQRLMEAFDPAPEQEISIECHPAYLDEQGWIALAEAGFNRISLGIQDFSPEVLKAVNRLPAQVKVERIFELLRARGIQLNLDLLYGLPLQTPESFAESIQQAIALAPDRLVTFSYAHVPWVKPQQKILEKRGLPTPEVKQAIFLRAKELLQEAGYRPLGLDHFVQEHDPLYRAQAEGLLHRNFQGYCTRATTGQVYAFGVTGISQLTGAYAQNTRNIDEYIQLITAGTLPIVRGYALSRDQQIAGEVIAMLMCNGRLRYAEVAALFGLSVEAMLATLKPNEELLQSLEADALITRHSEGLEVAPEAMPLIRVVASAFDPLSREGKQFSQAL